MPTLKTIPFITRFAPSPTGFLHLGHAYSALMAFETAQASRGMMHLRIDDIDQARCRAKYEAGLIEDLKGLGVSWAEPVVRQSDRSALYRQALEQLETMGVVYECYKTRKDMAEAALSAPHGHEPHPMSPAKGPPALRLSLNAARNHLGPLYNALTFYEDGWEPMLCDLKSTEMSFWRAKTLGLPIIWRVLLTTPKWGLPTSFAVRIYCNPPTPNVFYKPYCAYQHHAITTTNWWLMRAVKDWRNAKAACQFVIIVKKALRSMTSRP